jgi:hypothetical protein
MTERSIPLTPPGSHWSQTEYVACMRLGIGFAAHRYGEVKEVFHYHFPDIGCTSVIVFDDTVEKYIDHTFEPTIDWIKQCSSAIGNKQDR